MGWFRRSGQKKGESTSSEELWQALWPDEHYIDDERLKSGIKSLRKTLEDDAEFVANKRGVGYYIDLACLE